MKKKSIKLNRKYTAQELADSFVFRSELNTTEKVVADNTLKALRNKTADEMSDSLKLSMNLMSLKYQMEDYAKGIELNTENSFGLFLKKYAKTIRRKNYELANDLGMDVTRFSQIVNGYIIPSEKIIYRLEYHSDNLIPGIVWLGILHKDIERKAEKDTKIRTAEYKTVKNRIDIGKKIEFVSNNDKDIQHRIKSFNLNKVKGTTEAYPINNNNLRLASDIEGVYSKKKKNINRKK